MGPNDGNRAALRPGNYPAPWLFAEISEDLSGQARLEGGLVSGELLQQIGGRGNPPERGQPGKGFDRPGSGTATE